MGSNDTHRKKVQTVSYLGHATIEESELILQQMGGDVVKAVDYARNVYDERNPVKISDEAFAGIVKRLEPIISGITSTYTPEEIAEMGQQLKKKNDSEAVKFKERLIYGYMDKLN